MPLAASLTLQIYPRADAMAQIVIQNAPVPASLWPGVCEYGLTEHALRTYTTRIRPRRPLADAKQKGVEVETYTYPFNGRSIEPFLMGTREGFARLHIQKGTDKILGATIVSIPMRET